MDMKPHRKSIFEGIAFLITLLIVAFILVALISIIIGGLPFLWNALKSESVQYSMKLSLYTSTVSTIICMILALPCGYALARLKMPFKNFMQVIIELPLSLPYLVLGLCLLILFSSPMGKMLRDFGLPFVFHKNGIIIAQLAVNLPFAIRLIRTEISKLDYRLEFLAGMLGATPFQRFITIILPQCKVSIVMAVILIWSRALGEFGATLMLVGVTRMKTETLPAAIYLNISSGENGMAMACAIILLLFSSITLYVSSIYNKRLNNKINYREPQNE